MSSAWLRPSGETSDPRAVSRALAEYRGGWDPATGEPMRWARERRMKPGVAFAFGFLVSSALWGLTLLLGAFVR